MESYNNNSNRYQRAKEQVKKIKDFYSHLVVYLLFCGFFIFLNFRSGGFPWAIFPILGWGIGVGGHAMDTFSWNPFFGKEWEKRKIQELMEEERRQF